MTLQRYKTTPTCTLRAHRPWRAVKVHQTNAHAHSASCQCQSPFHRTCTTWMQIKKMHIARAQGLGRHEPKQGPRPKPSRLVLTWPWHDAVGKPWCWVDTVILFISVWWYPANLILIWCFRNAELHEGFTVVFIQRVRYCSQRCMISSRWRLISVCYLLDMEWKEAVSKDDFLVDREWS